MCAFMVTSDATAEYNCIAWAVYRQDQAIWPDEREQLAWPHDLPRQETLANFQRFFELAGFQVAQNGLLVPGVEKIALYCKDGLVNHAARQLPDGMWTSKMGPGADGSHPVDEAEFVRLFGNVALYLQRHRTGQPPRLPDLYPPRSRIIAPDGGPLIR